MNRPIRNDFSDDDVFAARPRTPILTETRPPWSEVYRWQRQAAWLGVIAVAGWFVSAVLLYLVVSR
ncbi:MAG: hypothetical protein J5I99_05845 [Verrucomicrobia bacterium]|nr:hypothetical protein [Verrucomicrobiota bacterium]